MDVEERLEEIAQKLAKRVDTKSCFQCGSCVSACPVSRITDGELYHPRRIVRATLEGEASKLLEQPSLWLCTSCHACLEHCPQKVPVSELVQDLQNLASELGVTPDDIVSEVENIIATGWALAPSESANKRRVELGLPPIPLEEKGKKDLHTIAKATELLSRLKKIKEHKAALKAADEAIQEGGEA
ncbi:MAG: 4Fe-4S dicluster domain-containing protein [Candidatus Hermodarchaeota archaeon]|nr:4Fe-4S dicluster domain-containing protein [Candidatus Hermodarchaeota archaeon]